MIPLPIHSYQRRGIGARLVNVQPEQSTEKGPVRLERSPGVRAWKSLGSGYGRGLHVMGDTLYAVSGTSLYNAVTGVSLGTIPGSSRVRMADNGSTLVVVTNPGAYAYTTSVAAISDADFPGASAVDFVDGYFVFVEPGTGRFFSSDLYSTDFDALKFATAEGAPDDLVDLIVDHRQVILGGARSVEIWWNSGADNFPFERAPNGFLEIGVRGGMAKLDNTVFFVATDNTVRRLNGSTPVRISTHAVEEAIGGYTSVPYAFTYTHEGHLLYVVQFAEATWAYDATTNEWHERETYRDGTSNPWRVCAAVHWRDAVYVQDYYTGAVGILDSDVYAEWGDTMRAEWTYQSVYDMNRRLFHRRLELLCETGVGLITGQGEVPSIVLSVSDDGGRTWRIAPTRDVGRIGDYTHRVQWHRLGSSRNRVYKMLVTDPVRLTVTGAQLEVA